jgi:hypothetical protein
MAVRRQAHRTASRQVGVALIRNLYQTPAHIRSTPNGLEVTHTEFFNSVKSTTASVDQVDAWTIQPGWSTMFPWLSGLASRFERYNFQRLAFDYRPRCSTSSSGSIVLSIDPDPDDSMVDATDAGRQVLLSHAGAAETQIWNSLHIEYPRPQLAELGHRFVCSDDTTPGPGAIEPRTTHAGYLTVGQFGQATSATYGDLTVSYTIRFWNPQLPWTNALIGEAKKGSATFQATAGSGLTWAAGASSGAKAVFASAGTIATTITGLSDTLNQTVLTFKAAEQGFQIAKQLISDLPDGADPMQGVNSPSVYTGDTTLSFRLYKSGETALPSGWTVYAGCYLPPSGTFRALTSVRCQVVPTTVAHVWVINFTFRGSINSSEIIRAYVTGLPDWGVYWTDGLVVALFDGSIEYLATLTSAYPTPRPLHLDPLTVTQYADLDRRIALARSTQVSFYPEPLEEKGKAACSDARDRRH